MSETIAPTVETLPDAVVIKVLAHLLDEENITALRTAIEGAVSKSPSLPFVIDMAAVKFVPSLTLGVLVRIISDFKARRQRLVFAALQPTVRQVLTITRLDRLMETMPDVAAARSSLGAMN